MRHLYYKVKCGSDKYIMTLSDLVIYIKSFEDSYEYDNDGNFRNFTIYPIWLTKKQFNNIKQKV